MSEAERVLKIQDLNLLGGQLSLDFVNTIEGRSDTYQTEYMHDYGDLIAWSVRLGQLDEQTGQGLLEQAAQHSSEAKEIYRQAIELRETLYRLFAAIVAAVAPSSSDLAELNQWLGEVLANSRLVTHENSFKLGWQAMGDNLTSPLWPVVRSAVELLTGDELDRVRECPGDHCNWLFVDRSRNHSRRWCNMLTCGNVDKARNFYERQRTVKAKRS